MGERKTEESYWEKVLNSLNSIESNYKTESESGPMPTNYYYNALYESVIL